MDERVHGWVRHKPEKEWFRRVTEPLNGWCQRAATAFTGCDAALIAERPERLLMLDWTPFRGSNERGAVDRVPLTRVVERLC